MLLYLVCLAFIIVAQRYGIYKNFHKKIPPDRISPKGWENYYAKVFAELFSKSDRNSYLFASSIATATATVIKATKMVAVTIGVVTCADER